MIDKEKIEMDAFVSSIMTGVCPKCGSTNTHDCDSEYTCPIAQRIDDPCVGHCEACGYIWCLECGEELSEEKPICGHWGVCDKCPNCPTDLEDTLKEKCPYEFETGNCPKIVKWKNERLC